MKRPFVRFNLAALLVVTATLLGIVGAFGPSVAEAQAPFSGAIFTTTPDGVEVNENVGYKSKCEVSLNGGPQGPQAHHLPDGDYDVAVTDPSGHIVLGWGRGTVTISNGVGTFGPTSLCDVTDPAPFLTTPNRGGVYKAWLCKTGELFVNRSCKTDNFKVTEVVPPGQPPVVGPPASQPPGQPPEKPPTSELGPPLKVEGPTPTTPPELPTELPAAGLTQESNSLGVMVIVLLAFGLTSTGSGWGLRWLTNRSS